MLKAVAERTEPHQPLPLTLCITVKSLNLTGSLSFPVCEVEVFLQRTVRMKGDCLFRSPASSSANVHFLFFFFYKFLSNSKMKFLCSSYTETFEAQPAHNYGISCIKGLYISFKSDLSSEGFPRSG